MLDTEEIERLTENKIELLLDLIRKVWWHAEDGVVLKKRGRTIYFQLHTFGWSDNEEIIEQLRKTSFWTRYWIMTKRGGHYYFQIKLPKASRNL